MNTTSTWPVKMWFAIVLSCLPAIGPLAAPEHPSELQGHCGWGFARCFRRWCSSKARNSSAAEVDLARALRKTLGRKVIFVELPWEESS